MQGNFHRIDTIKFGILVNTLMHDFLSEERILYFEGELFCKNVLTVDFCENIRHYLSSNSEMKRFRIIIHMFYFQQCSSPINFKPIACKENHDNPIDEKLFEEEADGGGGGLERSLAHLFL